ncbi:hypothetical protein SanaruYs_35580 [Chryseotalea sanaruensis]|uniref:Uncharacterized protein n=2 Tax=Chryseotalea sanaruensis TaxID=2482724 RepID=A0A401UEH0_9BACT|nr:hypothetical protein SanaruYs_35580 [Chryseotalea sanaruensis]
MVGCGSQEKPKEIQLGIDTVFNDISESFTPNTNQQDLNFEILSIENYVDSIELLPSADIKHVELKKNLNNKELYLNSEIYKNKGSIFKIILNSNYLSYYHPLIPKTDSTITNKFSREYYYRNGLLVYIKESYNLNNSTQAFENTYYLKKDSLIKWTSDYFFQHQQLYQQLDLVLTKFPQLDIIDVILKATNNLSDKNSLYGKSKTEAIEKWIDFKKIEDSTLIDVKIQNTNRFSNLIGITSYFNGKDTSEHYHILNFSYNTYLSPEYVEVTQQYFGKAVKKIEEISRPGDAMLYLLAKHQVRDTTSIKKLLSTDISLSSLGLIDFTDNECNIGLDNNFFNDKGIGEISYSGGGWGDTYVWEKSGKNPRLIFVSRYSH